MTTASTADESRNGTAIRKNMDRYNKKINDIYIDTYSIHALISHALEKKDRKIFTFEGKTKIPVPSMRGTSEVKRTAAQIKGIFEHARDYGQWEKSLIMMISITEDYIVSLLKAILRAKPLLLMTSIKTNDGKLTVSLADLINNGSESILEEQVVARINSAIYASPKDYGKYLGKLMDFEIPAEVIGRYIEIKARRDLIIHAGGIVNQMYIDKVGSLSEGRNVGEKIVVDRDYFEESMSAIKIFVSQITTRFREKFDQDEGLERVIATKGF